MDTTLLAMIDIMFVLLLFFMTATSFSKAGVTITPPSSSSAITPPKTPIEVTLSAEGAIYIGKTQVNLTEVAQTVAAQLQGRPNGNILFHPDRDTRTQALLAVIDACKQGGATQFQIAAIPGSK